jgi:hypothetical protein
MYRKVITSASHTQNQPVNDIREIIVVYCENNINTIYGQNWEHLNFKTGDTYCHVY